jgi:hypothetical protein
MVFVVMERKTVRRTRKLPMWLAILTMNCGVASTTPTALPRDVDQRTINLNVASNPSDSKVVAAEEQRREARLLTSRMRRYGDNGDLTFLWPIAPEEPVCARRLVLDVRLENFRFLIVWMFD